jgi:hypothetical protein
VNLLAESDRSALTPLEDAAIDGRVARRWTLRVPIEQAVAQGVPFEVPTQRCCRDTYGIREFEIEVSLVDGLLRRLRYAIAREHAAYGGPDRTTVTYDWTPAERAETDRGAVADALVRARPRRTGRRQSSDSGDARGAAHRPRGPSPPVAATARACVPGVQHHRVGVMDRARRVRLLARRTRGGGRRGVCRVPPIDPRGARRVVVRRPTAACSCPDRRLRRAVALDGRDRRRACRGSTRRRLPHGDRCRHEHHAGPAGACALLPEIVRTPDELAVANAASGTAEGLGASSVRSSPAC